MKLLNCSILLFATMMVVGPAPVACAQELRLPRTAMDVLNHVLPVASTDESGTSRNPVDHAVLREGGQPDNQTGQVNLVGFENAIPAVSEAGQVPVPGILAGPGSLTAVSPPAKKTVDPKPLLPMAIGAGSNLTEPPAPGSTTESPIPDIPSILSGLPVGTIVPPVSPPDSNGIAAANPSQANAPQQVTLMELKPALTGQLAPLSPGAVPGSNGLSYRSEIPELVLQPIQPEPVTPNGETDQPLELFEIERITSPVRYVLDGKFSVSEMIGPMTDAGSLLGRLNLDDPYRNSATQLQSPVRLTTGADGYTNFWLPVTYTWITPSFEHRPLYFEQPNLERYGIRPRTALEPVVSASKFFGTVVVLPFRMMHQNPCTEVSTLGHQRPGECADYLLRESRQR